MASSSKCPSLAFFFIIVAIWAPHLGSGRNLVPSSMSQMHEQWMAQHGRVYKDAEEKEHRLKIFKQNIDFIESFNKAGDKPYKLGANQFTDLTNEEFRAFHLGLRPNVHAPKPTPFMYANVSDSEVPSTVDWRKEGAVTNIKHQGKCGCCWAFSAVAAVEGITKKTTGNLISLSEQELVDCDTQNHGCDGGFPAVAFEFIQQNQGLTTEENYPYNGVGGTCDAEKSSDHAAQISGYENVPSNSEDALMKAVANQPVSVGIDASGPTFQHFAGGDVFTGDCGTELNHAVTVVGYGVTEDGNNYWLVKNSWGTSWGEGGYMRMQKDVDDAEGLCGIAMQASYPTASTN